MSTSGNALALVIAAAVVSLAPPAAFAQARPSSQGIDTLTSTRQSLLVAYEEGSTIVVELEGTSRLPDGEGRAEVRRRLGVTDIAIKLDKMKPATLFGGDFVTYVLWTVSPEGLAVNVGECILDGEKSELRVSSPLDMFGLFVTAEPHYLVQMPSRFVVLDNTVAGVTRGRMTTRPVEYRGFDGVYEFERESLIRLPTSRGMNRVERQQATVALALAERAGAVTFAAAEFAAASSAYARTAAAFDRGASQPELTLLSHETVRLAVGAANAARVRSQEAALEAERRAAQTEIDALTLAREAATRATVEAEAAATRLQGLREQAQQEAAEARAEAERFARLRDEATTQAERDRLAAEGARYAQREATNAQAAAEAAATQARQEQQAARDLAEQSRQEAERALALTQEAETEVARLSTLKAEAETEAERARRDAAEARDRMQNALSLVADTEESARGLIVNLPDILFRTDQAVLQPPARELLSRIAGVLLVAPAYALSIEGHTDATGSDDYNQSLSERRAASVRDYLAEAQVSSNRINTAGFGKTRPVASNDTADGRQQNRRVEIVIANTQPPNPQ